MIYDLYCFLLLWSIGQQWRRQQAIRKRGRKNDQVSAWSRALADTHIDRCIRIFPGSTEELQYIDWIHNRLL